MDFFGYLAAGGIERIAIVIAALLIVFWGYKLYVRGLASQRDEEGSAGAQSFMRSGTGPGLVFMGIGSAVLLISLFTGGTHLRSAGEAWRAAVPDDAAEAAGTAAAEAAPDAPAQVAMRVPEAAAEPVEAAVERMEAEPAPAPAAAVEAAAEPVAEATAEAVAEIETAPQAPPEIEPEVVVDFANSGELGGRIVEVKSEKATLEWSPPGS